METDMNDSLLAPINISVNHFLLYTKCGNRYPHTCIFFILIQYPNRSSKHLCHFHPSSRPTDYYIFDTVTFSLNVQCLFETFMYDSSQ